jgi:hypothetical protein
MGLVMTYALWLLTILAIGWRAWEMRQVHQALDRFAVATRLHTRAVTTLDAQLAQVEAVLLGLRPCGSGACPLLQTDAPPETPPRRSPAPAH